jgi:uncharacterized surface protein with fasciclin (FAS1) repeats
MTRTALPGTGLYARTTKGAVVRIAHSRRLALVGLAALAILGAGCSGGSEGKINQPADGVSAMPGGAASPAPIGAAAPTPGPGGGNLADAPFGTACASIPSVGPGSLEGMAKSAVATAASNNPALTKLVQAISTAGLTDTLNNAEAITVFAPTNDAFDAAGQAVSKAMADPKGKLTNVLTYHVVQGRLSPDQLVGTHKTMQGTTVRVTGGGEAFLVNDASVVCGNVKTANATVYLIDKVLMPKA